MFELDTETTGNTDPIENNITTTPVLFIRK